MWAAQATAAVYGLARGWGTVALPPVAVGVGYSAAEVGYLAAVPAAAQILGVAVGIGIVGVVAPWTAAVVMCLLMSGSRDHPGVVTSGSGLLRPCDA